jgi:hypothetical protein
MEVSWRKGIETRSNRSSKPAFLWALIGAADERLVIAARAGKEKTGVHSWNPIMSKTTTSPVLAPAKTRLTVVVKTAQSNGAPNRTMVNGKPDSKSQTQSVLSQLADTARRPSAVTLTLRTASLWPSRTLKHSPVSRSHTRSVLS